MHGGLCGWLHGRPKRFPRAAQVATSTATGSSPGSLNRRTGGGLDMLRALRATCSAFRKAVDKSGHRWPLKPNSKVYDEV